MKFDLSTERRPRDIVFVADASTEARWPTKWAMIVQFIKQVVQGLGASPEGTHYAFVAFANGAASLFSFPIGALQPSQYNVGVVHRFIDAGASRRPTGTQRNANLALQIVQGLLTDERQGVRPNAQKVSIACFLKYTLLEESSV